MSVCAATSSADQFNVVGWNPNGQEQGTMARIPVTGTSWTVTDPSGKPISSQVGGDPTLKFYFRNYVHIW